MGQLTFKSICLKKRRYVFLDCISKCTAILRKRVVMPQPMYQIERIRIKTSKAPNCKNSHAVREIKREEGSTQTGLHWPYIFFIKIKAFTTAVMIFTSLKMSKYYALIFNKNLQCNNNQKTWRASQ